MSTPDDRPGSRLRVAPWLPPEHAGTGEGATRELPVAPSQDTVELGLTRGPRRRYAMAVLCGVIVLLAGVGLWTATRTDDRPGPVLPTSTPEAAAPATRRATATTGAPTPSASPSPSPTPTRSGPRTSGPPTSAAPTATVLGAPDVPGHCAATTGGQARLRRAAQGPDAAVGNWACSDSLGLFLYDTDLTAACRRQHGPDARAEFTNRDDATSWQCRR